MKELPESLELIRNAKCKLCPLHETAQHVCLMGDGNVDHPKIMLVGEAPGQREDYIHKPFQGKAGKLLDSILYAFDIPRESIFITNAVRCRPPDNAKPSTKQIETCSSSYLQREINLVKPGLLVAMGAIAAQSLLGRKVSVTASRRTIFKTRDGKPLVVTFHPAAALYNDSLVSEIVSDFEWISNLKERDFTRKRKKVIYQQVPDLGHIPDLSSATTVYIDLETDGLDPFLKGRKIFSVQISVKEGTGYFCLWDDVVKDQVKAIVENPFITKVNQNLKFDLKWMYVLGIRPRGPMRCTLIMAHLLDENQRDKSLPSLASRYTDMKNLKEGLHEYKKKHKVAHVDVPLDILVPYGCADADAALRLDKIFHSRLLLNKQKPLLKLESNAIKMFTEIECNGFKIDVPLISKLIDKWDEMITHKENELASRLGRVINDRSPVQLKDLFYRRWKLPPMGLVKRWENKDGYDTTEYTLNRLLTLSSLSERQRAIISAVLYLRENRKILSTYLLGLQDCLRPGDLIHPSFRLDGTVTGRLSCYNPNLQQIPREGDIKRLFISRYAREGLVCQFDLSQAELRFGAHISRESTLLDLFHRGGVDIHRAVAAQVLHKPASRVTDQERKKAKTVNFGIFYGASAGKMAETMGVSYLEAARFIRDWKNGFPQWAEHERKVKREVIENGYVVSPFNRIRHLPIMDPESKQGKESIRQAINSPIQGGVCDYTLVAGWQARRKIREAKLKRTHFVAQVHDAWILDIHKDEVDEVVSIMKETHEHPDLSDFGLKLKVPMVIEAATGPNWKEVKPHA